MANFSGTAHRMKQMSLWQLKNYQYYLNNDETDSDHILYYNHLVIKAKRKEAFTEITREVAKLDSNSIAIQTTLDYLFNLPILQNNQAHHVHQILLQVGKRSTWHGLFPTSIREHFHADQLQATKVLGKLIAALLINLHEI